MKILRLLLFLFMGPSAFAACHAVGPTATGAGTGVDWNNIQVLPSSTAYVRGDIYYLKDGAYSSFTISPTVSGTTTVELRKAQSYDNGSSCGTSIAAGWNTSTMGSSQAVFTGTTPLTVGTSFITINGNGILTGWPAQGCGGQHTNFAASGSDTTTLTDCGIRLVTTDTVVAIVNRLNSGVQNFLMEYVEEVGTGVNNVNNNAVNAEFGNNGGATFAHIYGRNANCEYFSAINFQHTVHDSYFWFIQSSPSSCHPEAYLMANGSSNTALTPINDFNNIWRDISGTSTFATVSTGTIFINIWDDVFTCSPGGCQSGQSGNDDGIMWCGNTTSCTVNFNQNTVANITNGVNNDLVVFQAGATLTGNASNNLIYNVVNTPAIQGVTNSNNTYLNSGSGASGTGNVAVTSGAANPFVSSTTFNFNLTADSSNYNNRNATLGSPYNTDAAGNTFTTDRGAYQFAGAPLVAIVITPPADGYHITPPSGTLQLTAVCYSVAPTLTTPGTTMTCPTLTWGTNDVEDFVVSSAGLVSMGPGYGGVITSATRNSAGTVSTITTTSNLTQTCPSTLSCGLKPPGATSTGVVVTGITDTSFNVTATVASAVTNTITIPNVGTASATSSGGHIYRVTSAGNSVIYAYDPVTNVFGNSAIIVDSTPTVASLAWRPQNTTSINVVVGSTVMASAVDATISTVTGLEVGDYCAWTTSDATKATVNNVGLILGVAAGTPTITCTYRGNTISKTLNINAPTVASNTWNVLLTGGTIKDAAVPGGQCDGTLMVPLAGSSGGHCAFNNPQYCFTDETSSTVYTGPVQAGDTCIVGDAGPYNIAGKSSTVNWITQHNPSIVIPSGTPSQHTKLLSACFVAGNCTTSADAIGNRTVLIITYGAAVNGTVQEFFLNGQQNIDIQGFEIDRDTDCNKGATNLVDWACPNNISTFPFTTDDFTANINLTNRVRGFVYGITGTPGPNLNVTGSAFEGNYLSGVSLDDPFGFNGNRSYGFTSGTSVASPTTDYGFSGCTPEPLKAVTAASRDGAGNEILTFDPTTTEVNFSVAYGTKVVVAGMLPSDLNGTFVTNGITFNQDSVNITGVTCTVIGTVNTTVKCIITTATQPAFPAHAFVQISGSAVGFLNNLPVEILSVGTNTLTVWASAFSAQLFGGTPWSATTSAATAGTIAVANQVSVTAPGSAETASTLGTATHVLPYHDCMDQGDNGNGDAFGTGNTTRGPSNFFNTTFRYNMQDGLDGTHSTMTVMDAENNIAIHNEGAGFKYGNAAVIIFNNNINIGTAGYDMSTDPNRPPDYNQYFSLPYRGGNAQPFSVHAWTKATVSNNDVYSAFPVMFDDSIVDPDGCFSPICTTIGQFVFQNTLWMGYIDTNNPTNNGSLPTIYFAEGNNETWTWNNNMGYTVRNPPSGGSGNNYTATLPVVGGIASPISTLAQENRVLGVNVNLFLGSPAIGFGIQNSFTPTLDQAGTHRPNPPSTGALEFVTTTPMPIVLSGKIVFNGNLVIQ